MGSFQIARPPLSALGTNPARLKGGVGNTGSVYDNKRANESAHPILPRPTLPHNDAATEPPLPYTAVPCAPRRSGSGEVKEDPWFLPVFSIPPPPRKMGDGGIPPLPQEGQPGHPGNHFRNSATTASVVSKYAASSPGVADRRISILQWLHFLFICWFATDVEVPDIRSEVKSALTIRCQSHTIH